MVDSATNADNATNAVTAGNFTGPLGGDVTGTQSATIVARLQGRNVANSAPAAAAEQSRALLAGSTTLDGGTLTATSKRYRFSPQLLTGNNNVNNITFTGLE